jgi:hypothetical protein
MTAVQCLDERGFLLLEEEVEQTWEWITIKLLEDGFTKNREDSDSAEFSKVVGFSVITIFVSKEDAVDATD